MDGARAPASVTFAVKNDVGLVCRFVIKADRSASGSWDNSDNNITNDSNMTVLFLLFLFFFLVCHEKQRTVIRQLLCPSKYVLY